MNLHDLKLRLRALLTPGRAERDLHDELSFHIERETRKWVEAGMPPDQARTRARARFGSMTVVADECRDERRTAMVDDTLRDVQFAWRSFRRAPLAACTIVATVAIGLGVVAVLFTILNMFLFRVDAVPGISAMYAVERTAEAGGEPGPFTRPEFDALCRETSVFTDAYAAVSDIDLRVDGRTMRVTLVTGNAFDVLGVAPRMGRDLAPADDDAGGARVVVLSDRGWDRHFQRDPHVLGRTVLAGGAPFEIVGVMPAGFRGLEFDAPDLWAPLAQIAQFRPEDRGREAGVGLEIIGRLRPDVSMENARAQIAAWDSNQQAAAPERRDDRIALLPRRGTVQQPMQAMAVFTPLFFAFGLVLLIGCANVANLLLARGVARQREIGIRLSIGASRWRIVRQLMTESTLLALAAAGIGYLISRVTLAALVHWMLRAMPVDLGDPNLSMVVPAADWRVAVFLVVVAVIATAFFAVMPALQATRIDPVRALRGELVREARPGRAPNALIGIQVFASALLLICAAIFLRSTMASARFDPGFRTADTVLIDVLDETKRAPMLAEIGSAPAVAAYGAVRPNMLTWPFRALAVRGDSKTPVAFTTASAEYFAVFDIPILRGRPFTAAEADGEHPVVIVSESMARELWPDGPVVGETLRLEPDPEFGTAPMLPGLATVVGVSRDVAGFRITDIGQPDLFLPAGIHAAGTTIVARVNGDPDLARRTLLDRLIQVDPHMGQIVTFRTVARLETLFLQAAFWVALVLGALALVLTGSGLFSVLSYLIEQRTRDIGVRMALGASSGDVRQFVLTQMARPVVCGLLAGAGLAASLAGVLIATPAGAMIAEVVRITDPVPYAASLLVIVAACLLAAWIPAQRAARLDPMQTLRQP